MSKMLSIGWKEITNFDNFGALLSWVEIMVTTFLVLVFADMNHVSHSTLILIGLFTFVFSTFGMMFFLGWNKEKEQAAYMVRMQQRVHIRQQRQQQAAVSYVHSDDFIQVPLIDLREEAIKLGWDFSDGSEQSMEFAFAISQAALDFDVQFWGRENYSGSEEEKKTSDLVPIEASHWIKFTVEPVKFASSTDNVDTGTFEFPSMKAKGFCDLHVDCEQAMQWLSTMTNEFKNMDLKNPEAQTQT